MTDSPVPADAVTDEAIEAVAILLDEHALCGGGSRWNDTSPPGWRSQADLREAYRDMAREVLAAAAPLLLAAERAENESLRSDLAAARSERNILANAMASKRPDFSAETIRIQCDQREASDRRAQQAVARLASERARTAEAIAQKIDQALLKNSFIVGEPPTPHDSWQAGHDFGRSYGLQMAAWLAREYGEGS